MTVFNGSCVAMITPFNDNGVDFDTFGKLIDFYIDNGSDALCVCGTTGEPSTMTAEERDAVIKFAIQKINKRVPVIVGCGTNCTATAIENSVKAQNAGADAVLIVTPYYNKCTQRGLIAHYTAIANSVNIPVILYNVPGRTGVNLLPQTALALSEVKNIVGIKEASGNVSQLQQLCSLVDGKMDVYLGEDALTYVGMTLGAKGVISVSANVVPQKMHDICSLCDKGEYKTARDLQFSVNPLIDTLFCEVNPIPVKKAMSYLGYGDGKPRLPLTEMENDNAQKLFVEMQKLALI
jgi:4-hydroxy-tetrahydrodipicolinate synthase